MGNQRGSLIGNMPHLSTFKPEDKISFAIPRSPLIFECYRRVPPGVWDIDVYDKRTATTAVKVYQDLPGDQFVALCRLIVAKAKRFGMW